MPITVKFKKADQKIKRFFTKEDWKKTRWEKCKKKRRRWAHSMA